MAHQQSHGRESVCELSKKLRVARMDMAGHARQTYSLDGMYTHIDIIEWFRDVGARQFLPMSILTRLWLGKVSSTAFQERVFSTGAIVVSDRRTATDENRAEKQVILRHNRDEIDDQRLVLTSRAEDDIL